MEPNLLCVQDTASCIITIDFDKYSKVVSEKILNRYISSISFKIGYEDIIGRKYYQDRRFHMMLKFVINIPLFKVILFLHLRKLKIRKAILKASYKNRLLRL